MMATLTFICAAAASATDGVVTASSFGFDPEDSTEFLQKALDSGARRIVIDRRPAPWITRPLFVRSNCEVVFERGVEVVAKKGEFRGKNDSLFTLKRSENVKLSGYGATLRMHRADYAAAPYTKAEWRMSLNLLSCSNVVVEGFTLLESGGDGVYLGVTGEDHAPCRNVVLRDLVCDRQYRQGISVISARNLLIERCMLRGTGGTPPAAGIDFEPNRASEELSEIVMRDCIITNNHGAGIQYYLGQLNATTKPISVKIVNCLTTDNSRGFWLGHGRAPSHVRGGIACENCIIATRNAPAVHIPSQSDDAVSVTFEKCRLVDFQAKDSLLKGAPARRKFDPAAARPFDACPGKLVRMHPFRFRNGVTYRFYMATPGEARFSGKFTPVGKPEFIAAPIVVKDSSGATCASISLNGTAETPFSFNAKAPGFYTMTADVGSHAFGLSATSVPIAVVQPKACRSIYSTQGTLYIHADSNASFVVAASGAGSERVHVRLEDPSGKTRWDRDDVGEWTVHHAAPHPADGLWRINFSRPTNFFFEDFNIFQQGASPDLFLTPDKYW